MAEERKLEELVRAWKEQLSAKKILYFLRMSYYNGVYKLYINPPSTILIDTCYVPPKTRGRLIG